MRVVAVIALTGCFLKPAPPSGGDGGGGPDGGGSCTSWSAPMVIAGTWHGVGDDDTSPWLSDDGSQLWFARHSSMGVKLMYTLRQGPAFITASPGNPDVTLPYEDNPSFAADNDLDAFYDTGMAGMQTINEVLRSGSMTALSSSIAMHVELTAGSMEPWISPNGKTLLYARDLGTGVYGLFRATRTTGPKTGFFGETPLDLGGRSGESPTLSPTNELFYTDHEGGHTQIWVGTLAGTTVSSPHVAFIQESDAFFDASISSDGTTLVYAHKPSGAMSMIEYVQRTCM